MKVVPNTDSLEYGDERVKDLGLPIPSKQTPYEGEIVEWPSSLSELTLEDLSVQMTWWTGWSAYGRYSLSRAETNLASCEEAFTLNMGAYLVATSGDYPTVTAAKAAYAQKPDSISLKRQIMKLQAEKKIVGALLQGYDEKKKTVSRELTRRGIESDDTRGSGSRFTA